MQVLEFFTDTIAGPFLHYHPVEDTKHYRKIKKKKNDVILKVRLTWGKPFSIKGVSPWTY